MRCEVWATAARCIRCSARLYTRLPPLLCILSDETQPCLCSRIPPVSADFAAFTALAVPVGVAASAADSVAWSAASASETIGLVEPAASATAVSSPARGSTVSSFFFLLNICYSYLLQSATQTPDVIYQLESPAVAPWCGGERATSFPRASS